MHLLVTRPREDAAELSEALRVRGHRVTAEPLLRIEPVPGAEIGGCTYQAILVTSANGVRALEKSNEMPRLSVVPVLAVGQASSAAAMEAGFHNVVSADGDLDDLTRLVRSRCLPEAGPLLYAAGRRVSGDLKGLLEADGYEVERAVLYDAIEAQRISDETHQALERGEIDGVLLYSPRTARIWSRLAPDAGITHFCLSQAVSDALGGLSGPRLVAARPNQDDLLALIEAGP